MKQHTLNSACQFHGKGLHTGRIAEMTVKPAPENTGIVFLRKDVGTEAFVKALAENVSNTARSTTISEGEISVSTIEHIMLLSNWTMSKSLFWTVARSLM